MRCEREKPKPKPAPVVIPKLPAPKPIDIVCGPGASPVCTWCLKNPENADSSVCAKFKKANVGETDLPTCYQGPRLEYTDSSGQCLNFKALKDGDTFFYLGVPIVYHAGHSGKFEEMVKEQYDVNRGGQNVAVPRPSQVPVVSKPSGSAQGQCMEINPSTGQPCVTCLAKFLACGHRPNHAILRNCTYKNIECTNSCPANSDVMLEFEYRAEKKSVDPERGSLVQLDPESVKTYGDFVGSRPYCRR